MWLKLISEREEIGNLKFSYQNPTEFAKELININNGKKFYNVTSEKLDGGLEIALAIGDMTAAENVQAWVIPDFDHKVSEGGVAKTIQEYAKNTNQEQVVLESRGDYQKIVDAGTNYGYAHITTGFKTRGPEAFVHVVTAEVPSDIAQDIITEATYNALMTADMAGIESIAIPALNTGAASSFSTPQESAEAMLAGIQRFLQAKDGQQVLKKILIVAYQKDEQGKLLTKKQILDYSRTQQHVNNKIAIKSYGPEAHYAFIESLYGRFWKQMRTQGDLSPEFSVAKKVVFDMLEDVGGVFFNLLEEEESKQLKIDITSKLLQAAEANPEVALSKKFLKEFIKSISKFEIDDQEFDRAIDESINRYKHELDTEINRLQIGINKIQEVIDRQVTVLNSASHKKVTADSAKFGKLNDQINKAKDFINDCEKLRICVDRINRKIIDEQEFKAMQAKYEAAIKELKMQERKADDTIHGMQQTLQSMKHKYAQLENELEKERIKAQSLQQRQPIHAPTYRGSH